jgi:hypothetical protein
MIIRELLAKFGFEYDDTGQKQAESGIAKLKESAANLQTSIARIVTAGAIMAPVAALTKWASDAQENLNLLQLSFGENADAIVEWSAVAAKNLGRSKYTLRELAAEFGGLLQPMVGTNATLAKMSTGLSQMAVDLSSARNISENEALSALQSALSGNIISMKRFGVNLRLTRVASEAAARGWSTDTQELTQAQLAAIRYDLIMKDLAFIQGDAANTAHMFANSTRKTRDMLKDIATEIGFFFLPAMEASEMAFQRWLEPVASAAKAFRTWAADTNLAASAIKALGVVVAAVLIPPLLSILPLIAAFGALVFVIDDVMTYLQGGNSVLGDFVAWLDAVDSGKIQDLHPILFGLIWVLNRVRQGIGWLASGISTLFSQIISGDFSAFKNAWTSVVEWISLAWQNFSWDGLWETIKDRAAGAADWLATKWGDLVDWLGEKWAGFKIDWAPQLQAVKTFLADVALTVSDFLQTKFGKILFALLGMYLGKKLGAAAGSNMGKVGGYLGGRTKIPFSREIGSWLGEKVGSIGGGIGGAVAGGIAGTLTAGQLSGALSEAGNYLQRPSTLAASIPAGAQTVVNQGATTINVEAPQLPGESGLDHAKRIAQEVDARLEARDRDLFYELVQEAP